MKKYKVNDEYSILAALPNSFQISTKATSHRLVDYQDDPDAVNPHPITVELESLNSNHILLYTPRKYMRIVWYDDPDDPNGQIDMGLRTPDSGLDFASWLTLTNGVPQEVISMAYLVLTSPESVKHFEVPLFVPEFEPPSNNNSNKNNRIEPPPKVTTNTLKKKKKFKVRSGGGSTQRRLR
jgi:hypothetical protein